MQPWVPSLDIVHETTQRQMDLSKQNLVTITSKSEMIPKLGFDCAEVGRVMAANKQRRCVNWRQPNRVDAKPLQLVDPRNDTVEISFSVSIAIMERSDEDLVYRGSLPPLVHEPSLC